MVRRLLLATALLPLLAVCPSTAAFAQATSISAQAGPPAHISFVEGSATLERDGRADDAPGNMPLLAGDRVRTRAGRVEILFADGSTLHLDRDTTIDLQSDELVRLIDGRLRLSIPGPVRAVAYRIDAPHAWLQITEPGEYRATLLRTSAQEEFEAAVLRGRAELINEDGRTPLAAGERAFARANAAPSYAYVFNSASWDAFDRWSEDRRSERLGLSTQYLPDEVRPYAGTLDRYGAWRYESSYGYVWYPRVNVGWRPYYQGRWTTLPFYGWTWIGNDPWAWPTHHYGRWGLSAGVWFWIPGRTWAPAWVSWGYAPGYVSWCPLGWNNRPVIQINVSVRTGYDPWRAWTVVPQRHFGTGYVHRQVVSADYIDARTRSAFSYRDTAPALVGYAVPRASTPIRVAGTGSSRRSSLPLLTNRDAEGARRYGSPGSPASDRDSSARRGNAAGGYEANRPAGMSRDRTNAERSPERVARDGSVERTVPSGPVVRSDREPVRPASPERQTQVDRPAGDARSADLYRSRDGYRAGDTYDPGDRRPAPRVPQGAYERPATDRPANDRPATDRPAYDRPAYDRSAPERAPERVPERTYDRYPRSPQPVVEPPPAARAPSAQPGRADRPERDRGNPPPSGPPPSASRPRGGAPSGGTAVRRPGGGGV